MTEYIDIFDANFCPCGSMEREEAHRLGKWHCTIHCWVVNGSYKGGAILLQQRGTNVRYYPGLFDISAAGHIRSGEDLQQALREVDEELGIEVSPENLHFLGYRIEVSDWEEGNDKNREFAPTYMLRCDRPLAQYVPQVEEVEGLYWLPISDALKLFSGALQEVELEGICLNELRNGYKPALRVVKKDCFVPRKQNLYLTIAIMAERLIEGRFPIAVS